MLSLNDGNGAGSSNYRLCAEYQPASILQDILSVHGKRSVSKYLAIIVTPRLSLPKEYFFMAG